MPVDHHGANSWNVIVLVLMLHIIQDDLEAKRGVSQLGW
jgi:hypothetical protein